MVIRDSLEPLITPSNPLSFLLDWELTMKCNLDCSYCGTGLYGGHDNSTRHPPLDQCLSSLDFMYEYVDLYMQYKTPGLRKVVLNVYGGESLHHPDIVEILTQARERHQQYKDRWSLTIITTTNAIVSDKKLSAVIDLVDHFTVSYHAENTLDQKEQFKQNLLKIRDAGRPMKCVLLMHSEPELFEDAERMKAWLEQNNISVSPRALDHPKEWDQFKYTEKQIVWFNRLNGIADPYKQVERLKRLGIKYVIDFDDYWNLPKDHLLYGSYRANDIPNVLRYLIQNKFT